MVVAAAVVEVGQQVLEEYKACVRHEVCEVYESCELSEVCVGSVVFVVSLFHCPNLIQNLL